jgi:hypothetical protein
MIFAKRVLRKIFGPKKDEVTREWSNLHIAELHDLYPSPNILGVIKPRRVRCLENAARRRQRRGTYRVLVGKPEKKRTLGRPRQRQKVIFKCILKKLVGNRELD